jgi:glutamate/tyrosine decarboxylase-like PLP-dependent enzyme
LIEQLREDLVALKAAMSPLEPDSDDRRALGGKALDHALAFLDANPDSPANNSWSDVFARHLDPEFTAQGREPGEIFDYLAECVDRPGFTTTSPRFMAYIPGGALFHSAIGDFLAAVSNKYSGFASASPGAVRLENACTTWLAEVIGFPPESAGTLTSGGSIANLTAMVCARDAQDADGGGAVYRTKFAHYCVDKALHIAGRRGAPTRLVETDEQHRMRPEALDEAMSRDASESVRPWLVVASAGTVDTGAIDPLDEIADVCARHGAWFHVDGAYGGLFSLCDEGKARLKGIERADSVALDPHKTLFLPYGTGAVLVRDGAKLFSSFSASADYIRPLGESEVGISPAELSPELTRHFRALRLWLPLQLAGTDAFRAAQTEKLRLARYFHLRLSEIDGFDAGAEPQLSVVAFRYLPPDGSDPDEATERLMRDLIDEGRIMFSGTRIDGAYYIRCAILSFRTHVEHVDEAIDALVRAASRRTNG